MLTHPKSPADDLIRVKDPHGTGKVAITASAGLWRAAGLPAFLDNDDSETIIVPRDEKAGTVDALAAALMAQYILTEVRRTGGYCDHVALLREGWTRAQIERLGSRARALAAPQVKDAASARKNTARAAPPTADWMRDTPSLAEIMRKPTLAEIAQEHLNLLRMLADISGDPDAFANRIHRTSLALEGEG